MNQSKSEKRFGAPLLSPVEHAKKRIRRHLRNHSEGVSNSQLYAWIETVRKGGVITLQDYWTALKELKVEAVAVCTSGTWHFREKARELPPPPPVDSLDLPSDGLFAPRKRD